MNAMTHKALTVWRRMATLSQTVRSMSEYRPIDPRRQRQGPYTKIPFRRTIQREWAPISQV